MSVNLNSNLKYLDAINEPRGNNNFHYYLPLGSSEHAAPTMQIYIYFDKNGLYFLKPLKMGSVCDL